jgi:hypothetical protein
MLNPAVVLIRELQEFNAFLKKMLIVQIKMQKYFVF